MAHNRYIVDEREIDLLDRYEGTMAQRKNPHMYDILDCSRAVRRKEAKK